MYYYGLEINSIVKLTAATLGSPERLAFLRNGGGEAAAETYAAASDAQGDYGYLMVDY
jgi:hypothetical protein